MERDTLYLIWTDSESNRYKVAELYKENDKYYFKYILDEVKRAMEKGFTLLIGFSTVNATYENTRAFPSFWGKTTRQKATRN